MNGPEHYRRAEKTLNEALAVTDADLCVRLTGIAQVHATLALAAATAEGVDTESRFVDEWAGVLS